MVIYTKQKRQEKLLNEYVNNQVEYIYIKSGRTLNKRDIEEEVKNVVRERLKRPKATVFKYPRYGDIKEEVVDLLDYLNSNHLNGTSPSGTFFKRTSVGKPVLVDKLESDVAKRDIYKAKQFECTAKGDRVGELINYCMQTKAKISVNAVSGAHESQYSILYDPGCYNAITSTCRHNTKVAVAHTERFLASNFYWRTNEDVINWFIQLIRVCPKKEHIESILKESGIKIPLHDDVIEMVNRNLYIYGTKLSVHTSNWIYKLETHEVAFIFYAFNMYNLFMYNEKVFKPWLDDILKVDKIAIKNTSLDSIKDLNKDMIILIASSNPELMKGCTFKNIVEKAPDRARELIYLTNRFKDKLKQFSKVFNLFWNIPVDVPNNHDQTKMFRRVVPRGDTDSVFFTTKDWVKWYCGKVEFSNAGYYINALVTYMLSTSIKIALANSCINLNIEDSHVGYIRLKNEFLILINLNTPMAKHYASMVVLQEGITLPKPKISMSGKNLVGSDVCKETLEAISHFVEDDIINALYNKSKIQATDLIDSAMRAEATIINSINNGETTYYKGMPIKLKQDYNKDEDQSNYFYYKLWSSVYAKKYGEMNIPQRCMQIPVDAKLMVSEEYYDWLKKTDKHLYKRFREFMDRYPKKRMARLVIPNGITTPEEIKPLINIRGIVHANMFGIYLLLRTLGISYQFDKKVVLLSDFYNNPYLNK